LSETTLSEFGIDHDADAFYVSETEFFNNACQVELAQAELSHACPLCDEKLNAGLLLADRRGQPPPTSNLKCPLYLWTHSLRC
jgi:hypothetical protein